MDPVLTAVAGIAREAAGRMLADRASDTAATRSAAERFEDSLHQHLVMVASWSSTVQVFGMNRPLDIHDITVPLFLDSPRKYKGESSGSSIVRENDIITSAEHTLIIGDLGAGKTTYLKRIAFRMLMGEGTRQAESFPVVVICRDEKFGERSPLEVVIARILGLAVDRKDGEETWEYHARVMLAVAKFIDHTGAGIVIDGIDEVPAEFRASVVSSMEMMARRMTVSRIVASSRTGEINKVLEGWVVLEMHPLRPSQIQSIARMLLPGRSGDFLRACQSSPIADLLQRPLFIAHLCFIFDRNGEIPERPSSVYRQIVALSLRDWDAQRGVVRLTRYAGFHPEDKMEFLAALAYDLMMKRGGEVAMIFSAADLADGYSTLAARFGLPESEAFDVAREIASHTGIISETLNGFAFTHLSLQEYLVAYALVRRPLMATTSHSLPDFGPYVAVAAALSSSPSDWLGNAILNGYRRTGPALNDQFWRRVLAEGVILSESRPLGYAILTLLSDAVTPVLQSILNQANVRRSMSLAVRPYWVLEEESDSDSIKLALQDDIVARNMGAPIELEVLRKNLTFIDGSVTGSSLAIGMTGVDL